MPDARLLWVREDKIFHATLGDFEPRQITADGVSENKPRWSPDGTLVLFVREPAGVFVMNADFTGARRVIPYAHTASWTRDGLAITAIDGQDDHKVLRYVLAEDQVEEIYDSNDAAYAGHDQSGDSLSQAAELCVGGRFLLTFTADRGHHSYVVDLEQKTFLDNAEMDRGDCSPAWSPDGSYLTTTARTGDRPVLRTAFDPAGPVLGSSEYFVGIGDVCDCAYYVHDHRVSNDGQWVAMGGLDRDENNREIYIWRIGTPEADNVRVTFDTLEDHGPDLYVGDSLLPDGGTDAGQDGGTDAGVDAGVDAGMDAGVDAGEDAGPDGGPDVARDAGTGADGADEPGPRDDEEPIISGSCGCSDGHNDLPVACLLLAIWTRRRARGLPG